MKELTLRSFHSILKDVDADNDMDFTSFSDSLANVIGDYDIVNEIVHFIEEDLNIFSDADMLGLDENDLDAIVEFINTYEF